WGYTLTSNPNSSTVFSPLSTTASVIKTPSQTASSEADINDTFDINYGAKVDNTVEVGNYQMANNGAIVYYLTMDTTCTQYTVSFNPNGGTGTMENQGIETGEPTKLTSADSLTAPQGALYTDAGNNTITGDPDKLWTFWGWNTSVDGTGDWYKDKEAVENLTSVGSTITLYAQWKQATLADMTTGTSVTTEKVIDHNLMQDMKPEVCYNSTAYSTDTSSDAHNPYDASTNPNGYHTITLLDYRGKVTTGENPESPESYTVSKLPDNLCWMTKDLNLGRESGGENNNGTVTLTPDDTDITANFTLPASPTTYTTGTVGYYTPQILINHTVTSYTVNGVSYSPTIGHYSWAAATATNTSITASGEITTSICPKNWDLPTRMQFYNLRSVGSVTSATIAHSAPYNFVYGGYRYAAEGYYNQTSYGYYWTSSNSSSNYGYWNYVYSGGIYNSSTSSGYKYYGANVRCVASLGNITINYNGNTNDGGSTASQENVEITATKAANNGYIKNGYWFNGWNTEPDGSGISISADASVSSLNPKPNSIITLYAQWLPQYTITYVNNCKTYARTNSSCTQSVSNDTSTQSIALDNSGDGSGPLAAYNKWTLAGWKITGWTTNADGSGTEYRVSSTYTVPSGSSAGSGITLYAHWVPLYSIQYDGNGASNPNGMGTTNISGVKSVKQINVGEGDSVILLPSNFKRAGYGFAGWSTNPNATVTSGDKIYGPMETIDAPAYPNNGTNIITLYAVWIAAERDGSNGLVYLQDFTTSDCAALTKTDFDSSTGIITPGSVIALTDKRDNQVYTVAKLADNNCWMIENLRLEHAGTVGDSINDNGVTNQSLSQGYGGSTGIYGHFVGLADSETRFNGVTTSNTIYKASAASPIDTYDPVNNILEDIGLSNFPSYRFPRYNNSNTNSLVDGITYTQDFIKASNPSDSGTNYRTNSNLFSYGNYYTWPAAIANTNYYLGPITSESAGTSICPTNWHLPSSGGTTKEYGILSQNYGGTGGSQYSAKDGGEDMSKRLRTFPNNFLYAGSFTGTYIGSRGSSAYYWSRSALAGGSYDYLSYRLHFNSVNFHPSDDERKFYGFTVRCLMNPSMVEVVLDNNDNTSFISRIYGVPDNFVDLPQISRAGYRFIGWNTAANGSGTNYTNSYAIPPDLSTITLYAQWKPVYSIQYDGNGADNPNGMGTTDANGIKSVKQTEIVEGISVELLASNFKRAGYGFAGWSTDPDAWAHFTDNDSTNDPIIYGPMETISAPAYPNNGTSINTMYAVWVPAKKDGSNNPIYLQEWDNPTDTTDGCAALTSTSFNSTTGKITASKNSIIALTDKRDDEVYAIAKLADDNCWMIENLRLEHEGTVGSNKNDSSVTNESLSQGYGGTPSVYGTFVGLPNSESSWDTTSNSIYKSSANPPVDTYDPINNVLEDIGTTNYPSYRFPRYNSDNTKSLIDSTTYTQNYTNTSSPSGSGTFPRVNLYSYGNYYTWAAAKASTNYFGSSSVSESVDTSICPAGWHLPSSNGASKEYGTLSQSYGGTGNNQGSTASAGDVMSERFRRFPNNFLNSGYFNGSSASERGSSGQYWSRTGVSYGYDPNSYYLSLDSTSLFPSCNYYVRNNGFSVRCLMGS
ncbi:InlB B-repeat-containing protein, partial [Candidatus Saccharibacteria bacterium]|nr:InlB B-repeat-containing protein [Candidatus Saccharibacteria bacterium]